MKKIGIVVDSSCGLTKAEAEKRGWNFLPIIANIDGKEYFDGINLDADKYYNMASINQEVRTSATPPGIIMEVLEKASKEAEEVIVYGISTGLSSQTQNIKAFAKEFSNVKVVDSKGVGYGITRDIEEALKESDDHEEVFKTLSESTENMWGLAFPFSLKWLVKGGRISPAVAKMANLLNIVPIISFSEGKLGKYGKGRSLNKTVQKQARAIKEKYPNGEFLIYKGKFEGQEELIEKTKEILDISEVKYFPPVVANHTGPKVLAIIVRDKKHA